MIEASVSLFIAAVAGGAALINKLNNRIGRVHDRISGLDRRIDSLELTVAQEYVSKVDLSASITRIEDHMIRIENKLDQIVLKNS